MNQTNYLTLNDIYELGDDDNYEIFPDLDEIFTWTDPTDEEHVIKFSDVFNVTALMATRLFMWDYGDLLTDVAKTTDISALVFLKYKINVVLNKNEYKYKTIFGSVVQKYNPIWNVDGTSTEESVNTPNLTDTTSNTHISTGTYSDVIDHDNGGTVTSSNTGTDTVSGTSKINHSTVAQNQSATYQDESMHDVSKATSSVNYTDPNGDTSSTSTTHGMTTTVTDNSNWDQTLTHTNNLTDTDSSTVARTGRNTTTVTSKRQGNIGVTMTQQLLEAERRIADYSILDVMFKDIAKEVSIGIYNY